MRAVWSPLAVTSGLPSGLNAADADLVRVAAQDGQLLAAGGVPDAGGLVIAGGDDVRAVGAEGAELTQSV